MLQFAESPSCTPNHVLAAAPGAALTAAEFLAWLKRRLPLRRLALEALADKIVALAAQQAGVFVPVEELQRATDRFRQRLGLRTATDTHAWLAQNGLSVLDLEAMIRQPLLTERFRKHIAQPRLQEHFEQYAARYARVRLGSFSVAAEGLARELLARIQDEGADFVQLAREHGLAPAGGAAVVMRADLPPAAADLIFQARPDGVVGPWLGSGGWQLFWVHEFLPPILDEATMSRIHHEFFDAWLRERLAAAGIDLAALGPS